MNADNLSQVRGLLEKWSETDLHRRLGEHYPDTELDTVEIDVFSASEFAQMSKRVLEQFESEFEGPVAGLLPGSFQYEQIDAPNQIQNYRLLQQLSQFISNVESSSWAAAALNLRVLVAYQIVNGFWGKSERKFHHPGRERLMDMVSELESRLGQLGESQRSLMALIETDEATRLELASKFEGLLQEAATKVSAIAEKATETSELLDEKSAELSTMVSTGTGNETELKRMVTEFKESLDQANTVQTDLESKQEVFDVEVTESRKLLQAAKSVHDFIESKRAEIIDLTGKAAGGALGGKFETRRRRQAVAAGWWLFGVILFTVATSGWVFYISTQEIFHNGDLTGWQAFAWKFGLITPGVFLLGYAARQHGKERVLEEEYAYRAIVAMTLNAFADQVDECEEESQRMKLISATVEKLYQSPTAFAAKPEKADPGDSIRTILETLKQLKEVSS